ncbi:MAG: alpha/beta hydrolase [Actinomycetota bacterium]|nr:alpha/beta hydrolase [Actinomycetota bacterium]
MSSILFVHAAGMNRRSWEHQTEHFEEAVAVDLPGHGNSPAETLNSISDYADWLGETARQMGPSPVTLVGHSMGSLIALETAARNPDIVEKLILVATAASMPVHRDLLAASHANDASAAAMVMKWSLTGEAGFGRPKDWVKTISDTFVETAKSGVMARDFYACDSYTDTIAMAKKVRCPTLLLLGEHDIMTRPAAAQPLAAALSDARIVIIEGVGHMLALEKPQETNEAIDLFLAID